MKKTNEDHALYIKCTQCAHTYALLPNQDASLLAAGLLVYSSCRDWCEKCGCATEELEKAIAVPQIALQLIDELRDEGCIMWSPCDNASDYVCRYCGHRTKTNIDHTIQHFELCMWLKLEKLPQD